MNNEYIVADKILSTRAEQIGEDKLYHHGILGQKWGIRRYQNEDGSVTPAGEKRYKKADKKYEQDQAKYGFKDANGKIKERYREFYTTRNVERGISNFITRGGYDKEVRKELRGRSNLQDARRFGGITSGSKAAPLNAAILAGAAIAYGNMRSDPAIRAKMAAKFREFTGKRNFMGAAIEGIAKGAGTVHGKGKAFVEGIFEEVARRKTTKGFVNAEGHTVYDIAGYLPGR